MTNASLEKLKRLMPPLNPAPESLVNWQMAEEIFGVGFPTDFKEFVATYGNVIWCDLFRPIYPKTGTREECEKGKKRVIDILRSMCNAKLYDRDGNRVNILPYPTAEGLLPCLIDTNSDVVCWWTKGLPDDWTTVFFQEGNLFFYPFGVTQLICNWIEQIPPASEVWGIPNLAKFGIVQ